VTILGPVSYEESWQAMHFADVGVVVSAGPFMHNNESTKIYHYLRAGLPVVSESGFPNDDVVRSSGLGWLVGNENMREMAERVAAAASAKWDREAAARYVVDQHSWDKRAAIYDQIIRAELANSGH
jgi:glycosyltransferase involved in cell wall biosynthesis